MMRPSRDLVEEESPPMGQLEPADLACDGAREGSLLVTEQFTLDQSRRQGCTIHFDEGLAPPRAQVVQRSGHELLARSRLTGDQHRRSGRGHGFDGPKHLLDRPTLSDDLIEVVVTLDLFLKIAVLLLQPGAEPSD